MTVPNVFATMQRGNVAASLLDENFEYLSNSSFTVPTLAALKALTSRPPLVFPLGEVSFDDGWSGPFGWEAGSTTPADDENVVSPTSGPAGRFKRLAQMLLGSSLRIATPPSVNGTVAGQNSYMAGYIDVTGSRDGVSGWQNEYGLVVQMTSAAGSAEPVQAGKGAISAEITAQAGAGQSTALGSVITLESGFAVNTITSLGAEFDFNNNSGTNATDGDPQALGVWNGHILLTGAGSHQTNFGINIGGNNKIRNGIIFSNAGTINTDLISYSSAVVSFWDKGSHSYGIYADTATYSSAFIYGPSGVFQVTQAGNVKGLNFGAGVTPISNARLYIKGPGTTTNYGIYYTDSADALVFSVQDNKTASFGAGLTLGGGLTVGSTTMLTSSVALTNGAAAQTATLTNGPAAGNPTKWIPIDDNGTTRYIPAW